MTQKGDISICAKNVCIKINETVQVGTSEAFSEDENKILKAKNIDISVKNCITVTRSAGENINQNQVIQLKEENNIKGTVKFEM